MIVLGQTGENLFSRFAKESPKKTDQGKFAGREQRVANTEMKNKQLILEKGNYRTMKDRRHPAIF